MNVGIQIKDKVYGVQEEVAMYIADLRQQIVMLDKAITLAHRETKDAKEASGRQPAQPTQTPFQGKRR